jgi:hypothetical protein
LKHKCAFRSFNRKLIEVYVDILAN